MITQNFGYVVSVILGIDPVEQRLPAEAIHTDWQPSRHLLRQNLHPNNYCGTRFKRQGTQTSRFQPALSSQIGCTRVEAEKRQVSFESLDRSRAQLRQVPTGDPCFSTFVSSPKRFSHTVQQQTLPEYLERQKEIKSRYSLKIMKKRLSSSIDVNAIIESSVQAKFFSQLF